jgi:hypothetical protein
VGFVTKLNTGTPKLVYRADGGTDHAGQVLDWLKLAEVNDRERFSDGVSKCFRINWLLEAAGQTSGKVRRSARAAFITFPLRLSPRRPFSASGGFFQDARNST